MVEMHTHLRAQDVDLVLECADQIVPKRVSAIDAAPACLRDVAPDRPFGIDLSLP